VPNDASPIISRYSTLRALEYYSSIGITAIPFNALNEYDSVDRSFLLVPCSACITLDALKCITQPGLYQVDFGDTAYSTCPLVKFTTSIAEALAGIPTGTPKDSTPVVIPLFKDLMPMFTQLQHGQLHVFTPADMSGYPRELECVTKGLGLTQVVTTGSDGLSNVDLPVLLLLPNKDWIKDGNIALCTSFLAVCILDGAKLDDVGIQICKRADVIITTMRPVRNCKSTQLCISNWMQIPAVVIDLLGQLYGSKQHGELLSVSGLLTQFLGNGPTCA
jgi:hypothetical protein